MNSYGGPFLARCFRDFLAVTQSELQLNNGDIVQVVNRLSPSWYEGYLQNDPNKKIGVFPSNHVKPLPSHGVVAEALYDFVAEAPGQLSLKSGDLVSVTRRVGDDWLEGRLGLASGTFPKNYVKFIGDDEKSVEMTSTPDSILSPPSTPRITSSIGSSKRTMSGIVDVDKIEERKTWFLESTIDPVSAIALNDLQWERYEAMRNYEPKVGDELNIRRGDIIQVIETVGGSETNREMVLARNEQGDIGICPVDLLQRL